MYRKIRSLAETLGRGDMEPVANGWGHSQWTEGNTNPPTKSLTQNLSCLQVVQG